VGPASVEVRTHPQLGDNLVDGEAMSLYLFVDTTVEAGPD
jgi:hypothetical protein